MNTGFELTLEVFGIFKNKLSGNRKDTDLQIDVWKLFGLQG